MKKKREWKGFETYILAGLMALVIIAIVGAVICLAIALFQTAPLALSIIVTVIILIVPVGYFVIHVLGFEADNF